MPVPARPPHGRHPPPWLLGVLALCLLGGILRAGLMLAHQPLIALANSYDEVRYTGCFDLYPDRPDSVPPSRNSPETPFEYYRFIATEQPMCYWSSELAIQGAVVAIYEIQHALTGATRYSVRWVGALKFALLLAVWLALTRAWLQRGAWRAALANGLLLPLLFADPANSVYLNTFYAEWTALVAAYALCGLILLDDGAAATPVLRVLLALAAIALATSKIQHLLLPLGCSAVVVILRYPTSRHWSRAGLWVVLGASAGLALQTAQLQRDSDAIHAIDMFNRADVTFTGLLPSARDPAAAAATLGIAPDCLRFVGMRAWQMPDYPGAACPGLANVSRSRELALLVRDPGAAVRLWSHGALALDPWLAPGLGLVAGGDFAPLPAGFFSLSAALSAAPALRALVFGGPPLALLILLLAVLRRLSEVFLRFTALMVVIMVTTLTITVLGDGLADTPKQGHLIFNAALAWWLCLPALALRWPLAQMHAVDFDQQLGAADIAVQQQ